MWRVVRSVGAMLLWAGCSVDTAGLGDRDGSGELDAATDAFGARDARASLDGGDGGGLPDGGRIDAEAPDAERLADAGPDPCVDLPIPDTFAACPFGAPRRIDLLSETDATDDDPTLTADLLEMYFNSDRPGGEGYADVYVSRRDSVSDPWGAPRLVAGLSTSVGETTPEISEDGLTIWVASDQAGGEGDADIWRWTRPDRDSSWGGRTRIAELSTRERDVGAAPSRDGLWVTVSIRPAGGGDWDLYLSSRASRSATWGALLPIAELNTAGVELDGYLDATALHLFFDTDFGTGDRDLVVASRADLGSSFAPAVRIPGVNSAEGEEDPWLSRDRRYIVFASARDGSMDLFEAWR